VVEEVGDLILLEPGVHHDRHGADLEDPEQRTDELGAVGQGHDRALLVLQAEAPEDVAEAAREHLHVAGGVRTVRAGERRSVPAPLADARVQEEIGDVDRIGRVRHGASPATMRQLYARDRRARGFVREWPEDRRRSTGRPLSMDASQIAELVWTGGAPVL